MILSKKQASKLGYSNVIDVKYMIDSEYVNEQSNKGFKNKLINWLIGFIFIAGLINLCIVGMIRVNASDEDLDKIKTEKGEVIKFEYEGKNLNNAVLKWTTGRRHLVTVYEKQVKVMQDLGYSKTRILDLLAFRSMECNLQNGKCTGLNGADIGPFQINQVHRIDFKKSKELWDDEEKLFEYQLKVANGLLDAYEKNFCGEKHFKLIGKEYTNKERFKCYARCYNGGKYKKEYGERSFSTRGIIKYFYNLKF